MLNGGGGMRGVLHRYTHAIDQEEDF